MERQVVWLGAEATTYTAMCESCLDELAASAGGAALAYRSAKVAGSLRADADVGFGRCPRGHRLAVRRATCGPLVALRS